MGVKKCRQGYITTIGKSWMAGWIVSTYQSSPTSLLTYVAVLWSHGCSIDPRWIGRFAHQLSRIDQPPRRNLFPYWTYHARPYRSGPVYCQLHAGRYDLLEEKDQVVGITPQLVHCLLWEPRWCPFFRRFHG